MKSTGETRAEADHLETLLTFGNDFDRKIARGVPGSYGDPDFTGKTVLDIGAQIGAFSVYAAWKGAKRILAVEPLPRNLEVLKVNAAKYPQIEVFEGAAVTDVTIPRVITSGAEITNHSDSNFGHSILRVKKELKPSSRVATHPVSLFSFRGLLACNPHIIKMDCEGSEHEMLEGFVAGPEVEALLLEVHFFDYRVQKGWKDRLQALLDQGFRIVRGRPSIIKGIGQYGILTLLRG